MEDPFSFSALTRGVWFPGQGDGWCMGEGDVCGSEDVRDEDERRHTRRWKDAHVREEGE